MDYATANKQLQGRCYNSRKVANNTYLIRDGEDIAVRLHNTNVVTFKPNGDVVLDSGGWKTVTTKERMNRFMPHFGLYQEKGVWYVADGYCYGCTDETAHVKVAYADGMTIHADGSITGTGKFTPKADKETKKAVKAFAKLCANSIPLEKPSDADCWYCYMWDNGDPNSSHEHIDSHIEEGYVVPSLVYRALEAHHNAPAAFWGAFKNDEGKDNGLAGIARWAVEKSVYRYICRRKGFAV